MDTCSAEVLGAECFVGDNAASIIEVSALHCFNKVKMLNQDCEDSPTNPQFLPSSGSSYIPSQQSAGSLDHLGTHSWHTFLNLSVLNYNL